MSEEILSVSAQDLYDQFGRGAGKSYEDIREQAEGIRESVEEKADYIEAWHKTTHRLRDVIQEEGLLPRENSGMPSRDASEDEDLDAESFPDRVYFTVNEGGTYPDADAATVGVLGGRKMQVKAYLDMDNLGPDEDSAYNDYMKSLLTHGTLAHKGPIKPQRKDGQSWIAGMDIDEDINMPEPVGWHIYQNEDEFDEQQIERIRQSYESQLSASEASWLMEHNRKRKENTGKIPRPTAMRPEPEESLEDIIGDLEDE